MSSILAKDSDLHFPHITLLRASAGSGKTYSLTLRFVQYLLSDRIPGNDLRNILAVTFSNNAAREMKERILKWLKQTYLGDDHALDELERLLSTDRARIRDRAGKTIDHILENYSDLQVKTIDSFMASVFRSSAIGAGYDPDSEIVLSNDELIDYALSVYLKRVRNNSPEASLFLKLTDLIAATVRTGGRYEWDSTVSVNNQIKKLYNKISTLPHEIRTEDLSGELAGLFERISRATVEINRLIDESGLERMSACSFQKVDEAVRRGSIRDILGEEFKRLPVKKSNPARYRKYEPLIARKQEELRGLLAAYAEHYAATYYTPYVSFLREIEDIIGDAQKQQRLIFLGDIGRKLAASLNADSIPEVYLMLGDLIYHFLIDEFQDTSPIQWTSIKPLIENTLAQRGSLFVVGDTKQAIYTFRGADYKIMRNMQDRPEFPSAEQEMKNLETNFRSHEKILQFNERYFDAITADEQFSTPSTLSGLEHHRQLIKPDYGGKGYVEVHRFGYDKESGIFPEKATVLEIVNDAVRRGHAHRDIAVLTMKNDRVERVGTWLSELKIPFLSFSTLDIRKRKIIGELISLLSFLNSPVDNLSFATVLLSGMLAPVLRDMHIETAEIRRHVSPGSGRRDSTSEPLYKLIHRTYPGLWENFFEGLFNRTGYLPLYDLVTEIYRTFSLYGHFPDEEAALTRFLEAVKSFEESGGNSLSEFISFSGEDTEESSWNLESPQTIDAVRLMTIHKAKGLDFPVVIVLLYGARRQPNEYYIAEDAHEARILKIDASLATASPLLKKIRDAQSDADDTDFLNALYVALTRAEEEMYVLGIEGYQGNRLIELLPLDEFKPGVRPSAPPRREPDLMQASVIHSPIKPIQDLSGKSGSDEDGAYSPAGSRRGELLHGLLAGIEYSDDIEAARSGEQERADDEMFDAVAEFLRLPGLAAYFAKKRGRKIYSEYELTDREGRLFRADRLIVDEDQITVIDFKTGTERGQYAQQIEGYMSILKEIHPSKRIEGILAYIDRRKIVPVKQRANRNS